MRHLCIMPDLEIKEDTHGVFIGAFFTDDEDEELLGQGKTTERRWLTIARRTGLDREIK